MRPGRAIPLLALVPLLAMFCGCAGYTLGPTGGQVAGARAVRVNFFQNDTPQPRLSEALNQSLRRAIQQDGTLRLTTDPDVTAPDIIVSGAILSYTRPAVTFQSADVITVQDYYLYMTARVIATDRSSGKILVDRPVTGRTLVRSKTDQATAERLALPMLAEDLARKITSLLVDGEW